MTRAAARTAPMPGPASLQAQVIELADKLAGATGRLRRLAEAKSRLSRLLDQVLEGIDAGIVLRAEGRIVAANRAAREMGAVSRVGTAETCHRSIAGAEEGTVRPSGAGGPTWLVRRRAVPLEDGRTGELIVVHDVSRLVELECEARRKSRLELLGRMAAEVAHEVRNPLGSLELLASILAEELEDDPDNRELAVQIQVGVRQLSATVTRLLATARGTRVRPRPVDAVAVAREAGAFFEPLARSRGLRLALRFPRESLAAVIDPEAVQQALLNLLGNALEASPPGGEITLGVRIEEDLLVFEVGDEGPGVPEALRERIFEPFYTTRDQGTGLGLALVERVAMAHGGRVTVGEAPAGGALFRLHLPARGPKGCGAPEESER
ncbi:MAG: hypothetical protein D6718_11940 [Acidobacteria bacterium]|nr:MAG: hypothetical protein D6718_11940 [Acidobacteriota bacterium]